MWGLGFRVEGLGFRVGGLGFGMTWEVSETPKPGVLGFVWINGKSSWGLAWRVAKDKQQDC